MTKKTEVKKEAGANIYEKILNIQKDIHTVIKSGTNTFHNYKFAKERDVIAEIKPLLGREGIAITHSLESEEEVERVSDKGGKSHMSKLTILFRLTNIKNPDDFITCRAIGYGNDNQDKGAPKAYTMALKYMLSKMFLIETGDDAENPTGGKTVGKNSPAYENTDEKFAKAKHMISESRNTEGLLEYVSNLDGKQSSFTVAQKSQLKAAVKARLDVLDGAK